MSLRALFLAYISSRVAAVPLRPQAAEDVWFDSLPNNVAWTDAPQVRGTFDLLLSCITTLSLCAWTAYHPNVYYTSSGWRRLGHRALWMAIAVFLPEVVLYCAWEQWWAARKLRNAIDTTGASAFDGNGVRTTTEGCTSCPGARPSSSLPDNSSDLQTSGTHAPTASKSEQDSKPQRKTSGRLQQFGSSLSAVFKRQKKKKRWTWTTEQAFFALTGGFAIPAPSRLESATALENKSAAPTHLTLTPSGILFLAQLGLLPNTTPETVSDKSKADLIAKLVVCIQAGWFLLQCLARTVKGLPLSLLEIHVLTHVLCAFAMYLLWIDKPYDVGSPIMIEDDVVRDLGALWMLGNSETTGLGIDAKLGYDDSLECALTSEVHLSHIQAFYRAPHGNSTYQRYTSLVRKQFKRNVPPILEAEPETRLALPNELETTHLEQANAALKFLKSLDIHFPYHSKADELSYRRDDPQDQTIYRHSTPNARIRFATQYVIPERSNLLIDGLTDLTGDKSHSTHVLRSLKTFAFMGSAYGGLHLAAWNAHFASNIEAWLWRASGIVMITMPVASAIVGTCFALDDTLRTRWRRYRDDPATNSVRRMVERVRWHVLKYLGLSAMWPAAMVALVAVVVYPAARVYVLAESFAGLRSAEKGIYKTVEWTGFIPHAG